MTVQLIQLKMLVILATCYGLTTACAAKNDQSVFVGNTPQSAQANLAPTPTTVEQAGVAILPPEMLVLDTATGVTKSTEGILEKGGQTATFTLEVQAGRRYVVFAEEGCNDVGLIEVFDADDLQLFKFNFPPDETGCSAGESFDAAETGTIRINVSNPTARETSYRFAVADITDSTADSNPGPSQVATIPASPTAIPVKTLDGRAVGPLVEGELVYPGEFDEYHLKLEAGESYTVRTAGGCTEGGEIEVSMWDTKLGAFGFRPFETDCVTQISLRPTQTGTALLTVSTFFGSTKTPYSFQVIKV